jgi:serine/threonine protein kinase
LLVSRRQPVDRRGPIVSGDKLELDRGDVPEPADPLVGATLKGTYHVLRKVAEGGMGVVYEGEHVRLRRRVAIKVLLSQYARHPEVLARFRREAEVVGSLGHPHIVQVFDVDETDGGDPFLVMEFLEGETLAERLEREPRQPLPAAIRIASQVAAALASTHEKGVVHRDLKPENVFLVHATGEGDFVKVLDFGISKVRGPGRKLTQHNIVVGTPLYMAPEQARADQDVDERVDQFALAAISYEMLAGVGPFSGDTPVEIMQNVIAANPEPLSEIAPWVPAAVAQVVMRGLSKKKQDRYASISGFLQALREAGAGAEVAVTEPPGAIASSRVAVQEVRTLPSSQPPPRPALVQAGRTPPPPPPEHLVERVTPVPESRGVMPSPSSIAPISRAFGSVPPNPVEANAERAEELFNEMRMAFRAERLDDAVGHAEKLLELAMFGRDEGVYKVLRMALPIINHVFETRVGPPERRMVVTALGRDPIGLNLSPKAAFVMSCAEGGASVQEVLDTCGIPRRDAVRMLAGLLRRGALAAE